MKSYSGVRGSLKYSRRSLLGAAMLPFSYGYAEQLVAQVSPETVVGALDDGIEVRDYRIFPFREGNRFLMEVHNTTSVLIDTPIIGVILNHLPENENFGVAMPCSDVLHPHSSGVLIGVAPTGLESDDDWGTPEWIFCNEIQTLRSDLVEPLNIVLAQKLNVFNDDHGQVEVLLTNLGSEATGEFMLNGFFRDESGRVCGTVEPWIAWWIEVGETQEVHLVVKRDIHYVGSPFPLIDTVSNLTAEMSVQPRPVYRPPTCPVVMPWNR